MEKIIDDSRDLKNREYKSMKKLIPKVDFSEKPSMKFKLFSQTD